MPTCSGSRATRRRCQEEAREFFTTAVAGDFAGVAHDDTEEVDKDHGRLEVRWHWVTEELSTLSDVQRWSRLRRIGLVERECWRGDHHTIEQRLFISSIRADAKCFSHAVRGHWGVENRLHWHLDVVCGEDASCIRKRHAPAIMTTIRHLCMNLFESRSPRSCVLRRSAARPLGTMTTALRSSSAEDL